MTNFLSFFFASNLNESDEEMDDNISDFEANSVDVDFQNLTAF